MNFSIRLDMPLNALSARVRAMAQMKPRHGRDPQSSAGLPSTSNIRDPAEIEALRRFEEPPRTVR